MAWTGFGGGAVLSSSLKTEEMLEVDGEESVVPLSQFSQRAPLVVDSMRTSFNEQ